MERGILASIIGSILILLLMSFYVYQLQDKSTLTFLGMVAFPIGSGLIIANIIGMVDNRKIIRKINSLNTAISSRDANFRISLDNLNYIQIIENFKALFKREKAEIKSLEIVQKEYVVNAIRLKYNSIYQKPMPLSEKKKMMNMTLKELVAINNDYLRKFADDFNKKIEEKYNMELKLDSRYYVYSLMNVSGLILLFISNITL